MMTLEEYKTRINRLITENSGEIELNGSHDHASVIIDCMLARAQSSVRILSRTFDPRIYAKSDVVASARLFLGEQGRKCQVLVEEVSPVWNENDFVALEKLFPNLEIKQVPEVLRDAVSMNFALMDDNGLRFEKDQTEASAFVTFGKKELTSDLSRLFEKLWVYSTPVQVS
jgi:Ca2+-dependent lipid-binding protein